MDYFQIDAIRFDVSKRHRLKPYYFGNINHHYIVPRKIGCQLNRNLHRNQKTKCLQPVIVLLFFCLYLLYVRLSSFFTSARSIRLAEIKVKIKDIHIHAWATTRIKTKIPIAQERHSRIQTSGAKGCSGRINCNRLVSNELFFFILSIQIKFSEMKREEFQVKYETFDFATPLYSPSILIGSMNLSIQNKKRKKEGTKNNSAYIS